MNREAALKSEKDEIRKLIKYFHPDAFQEGTPEDKERAAMIAQSLSAMLELNDQKKLISENGWPKGTIDPIAIPLIAYADGRRIAVNYRFPQLATPQQYLDIVREFHTDPAAYLERVQAHNRATQEHEEAERERVRKADELRKTAEEARKAAEELAETEHTRLVQVINKEYGIRYDYGSIIAEHDRKARISAVHRAQELQRIVKIFEQVGPPIADARGLHLTMTRSGVSRIDGVMLWVNATQEPAQAARSILASLQERKQRAEAGKLLNEKKPFAFSPSQFKEIPPEAIIQYVHRIQHALDHAENAWILRSDLVNIANITRSHIDPAQVRYALHRTDPTKTTNVTFEIGINASTPVIAGLFNTAGKEIIDFYPSNLVAPRKAPLIGRYLETKYGVHFNSQKPDSKLVTPTEHLKFLERLQSAFDKLSDFERQWLRNMTVSTPNEGTRLMGRRVGSPKISVHRNMMVAPYDAREVDILTALRKEVKKKMDA